MRQFTAVTAVDRDALDITRADAVDAAIQRFRPAVVINCAAYTQVDQCESRPRDARQVNARGPANLARSVAKAGGHLVHISTDYVFAGRKPVPEPYDENDRPNPVSCYGQTKFEGEEIIRQTTPHHLIVRTSWLYGMNGANFLKTILGRALHHPAREIRVVDDQFGSPTWSWGLALQLARLISAGWHGTCHASAEGHGSWYALARLFLQHMQVPHKIVPCTSQAYVTAARRPQNSILANNRLKAGGLNMMPDWREDLARFVTAFRNRLIAECRPDANPIPTG